MAGQRLTTPWRRLAWPVAAGLLSMAAHLPWFMHRLLDGDEAIYGSIAALGTMGGGVYGAGGIDNKPPGVFWIYALVFRVFGEYQMTAVHVAGFTAMAATCAVIFLIARGLAGSRAGLISALLYGVLTAAGNPRLLAANTEDFLLLPLSASVLLVLPRRWFWTRAVLVAAGVFRQSAAVNVVLVGLALFWLEPPERRGPAAGLFGGGLLPGRAGGAGLIRVPRVR